MLKQLTDWVRVLFDNLKVTSLTLSKNIANDFDGLKVAQFSFVIGVN